MPGVPLFVESISNSPRPIPYLKDEFWKGFPNLNAQDIVSFLTLCQKGHAIEVDTPEAGMDKNEFDQKRQKSEFLKSVAYLRTNCGAG